MTYPEIIAAREGSLTDHQVGVFEAARRLRRLAYVEQHMVRILGGWIPSIPHWQTKHALGSILWEDAEHCTWLRERLQTMRGANINQEPTPALQYLVREVVHAADTAEFIVGIFLVLKQQLLDGYQQCLRESNAILDAPSHRVIRNIVAEEAQHVAWAQQQLAMHWPAATGEQPQSAACAEWRHYVAQLIAGAGGILGTAQEERLPERPRRQPFMRADSPAREAHLQVTYQFDPLPTPADVPARRVHRFAIYMNEMMAAEVLASILYDANDMPWEYYHDIARHCWDELRHSQMGQRRLEELGENPEAFTRPIHNYCARVRMGWLRAFCHVTMLSERPAMKGKKESLSFFERSEDPRSAAFVDYDWSDEVLHVRYGYKWLAHVFEQDKEKLEEFIAETKLLYDQNMRALRHQQTPTGAASGTGNAAY